MVGLWLSLNVLSFKLVHIIIPQPRDKDLSLAMKRLTSGAWRRLTDYYIAWESLMIGHHEGTITMRIFDVAGWRPPVIVSLFVVVNQS